MERLRASERPVVLSFAVRNIPVVRAFAASLSTVQWETRRERVPA
jgi:hypothetical protein